MHAYTPEELAGIEAQHNEGRLMPYIELPLIGGQHMVRLLRRGDRYVVEMKPEEATSYLQGINPACAMHDVATMNLSHGNVSTQVLHDVIDKQDPSVHLAEWSDWRNMVVQNLMRHGNIDKDLARRLAYFYQDMAPKTS